MSDANRAQLYAVKESSYGVTPSSALNELRYAGESLKQTITNVQSKEIRADRQVTDLIRTNFEPQGGFNGELSYAAYDDLFESLFANAWGSALTLTGITISAAASDNSFNFSANNAPLFVPGQWIKVAGFATNGNNGYFKVVSRTVGKVVVAGGASALVNESAGPSVTVSGTTLTNGTTLKSLTMEKAFADKSLYHTYTGMVASQADFSLTAGEILTVNFGFQGKGHVAGSSSAGTGGPTAAPTNPVMSSVANVARLLEGGASLAAGIYMRELKFTINNNVRQRPALGVLGSVGSALGEMTVTGSCSIYFENNTLYNKYLNGTETSLAAVLTDASGNTYIFSMPRVKLSDGEVFAGSSNTDVMAMFQLQALRDPTSGQTMFLDKFTAP